MPISSVNSATFVIEFRAQLLFFSSQRPQGEELVVDLVGAEGGGDEDFSHSFEQFFRGDKRLDYIRMYIPFCWIGDYRS